MAEEALTELDFQKLREPERRTAILDQAWQAFDSPLAHAATQMWVAAYTEPELAETMRELERDISAIVFATRSHALPR